MKTLGFLILSLLLVTPNAIAKVPKAVTQWEQAVQKNPKVMDQLVMYPADTREAMLEASLFPETVARLGAEQEQTSRQFRNLVRTYPKATQKMVYELVRYPTLMQQLVVNGKLSKGKIKKLAEGYPKDIQKAAVQLGRKNFELLSQIQGLYHEANQNYDKAIQELPLATQTAFRRLLKTPEVLSLMTQNMDLTRLMGEAYQADRAGVISQLDVMSTKIQQEDSDALTQYEEELRKDPKAMKEMEQAANVYAKENGYNLEEIPPQEKTTQVYVSLNPYPYWFGYPYWYAYPYWAPYPYWWQLGFYYGIGGGIYFWGYPSYYYSRWFYGYPGYYNRYPYLSYRYGRHNYWYRNRYGYGRGPYYRTGYRGGRYDGRAYRGGSSFDGRRGFRHGFHNSVSDGMRRTSNFRGGPGFRSKGSVPTRGPGVRPGVRSRSTVGATPSGNRGTVRTRGTRDVRFQGANPARTGRSNIQRTRSVPNRVRTTSPARGTRFQSTGAGFSGSRGTFRGTSNRGMGGFRGSSSRGGSFRGGSIRGGGFRGGGFRGGGFRGGGGRRR